MLSDIYGWFTEEFDTADLKDAKALLDIYQCDGAATKVVKSDRQIHHEWDVNTGEVITVIEILPPIPPLQDEDAAWARQLLAQAQS